jgi:hypothetical protein
MGPVTKGWVVFAVIACGLGVVFLLMGMGMNLGRWWPVMFAAAGIAAIAANPRRTESCILGLLLLGWSGLAILSLHHGELEFVRNGWLFYFGSSIIWMPVAFLLGRLIGR